MNSIGTPDTVRPESMLLNVENLCIKIREDGTHLRTYERGAHQDIGISGPFAVDGICKTLDWHTNMHKEIYQCTACEHSSNHMHDSPSTVTIPLFVRGLGGTAAAEASGLPELVADCRFISSCE
jgi:hypothetical protein